MQKQKAKQNVTIVGTIEVALPKQERHAQETLFD